MDECYSWWSSRWSDATGLAGYATLMMTMRTVESYMVIYAANSYTYYY